MTVHLFSSSRKGVAASDSFFSAAQPPAHLRTETLGFFGLLAAAIITGLRLAREPRLGQTERVINAVEDGIFLANQIYEKALLRYGQGNVDFKW